MIAEQMFAFCQTVLFKIYFNGNYRKDMVLQICGYGDSVGIPVGFSVGMGWAKGLKSNPHGSSAHSSQHRGSVN